MEETHASGTALTRRLYQAMWAGLGGPGDADDLVTFGNGEVLPCAPRGTCSGPSFLLLDRWGPLPSLDASKEETFLNVNENELTFT